MELCNLISNDLSAVRTRGNVIHTWHSHSEDLNDWSNTRKDNVQHKIGKLNTPHLLPNALERKSPSVERAGNIDNSRSRLLNHAGDFKSPLRNEFSWTSLISQYAKSGQGSQALTMYEEMQKDGVRPSQRTFVALLKACGSMQDLKNAKRIHSDVVNSGFESDLYVGTMLVDTYAKCRSLVDARHAFERMPRRDAVSWNAMILGYTQMNEGEEALQLYIRMQQEGVTPHDRTYVSVLKACSTVAESGETDGGEGILVKARCLDTVRAVHADIVKAKLQSGVFVANSLVDAYGKCGSLVDARRVFEDIPRRDVVAWNTMILGYAQTDNGEEALRLYRRMQAEGVVPDSRTYVSVLKACSTMAGSVEEKEGEGATAAKETCLQTARSIHTDIVNAKLKPDVYVDTMLVDVYSKCGSLMDARGVFEKMPNRNVVSWNAMILGYAEMQRGQEALQLYTRMQREGLVPNDRTYVSALKACGNLAGSVDRDGEDETVLRQHYLETVRAIYSNVKNENLDSDVFVANMLVEAFAKCGSLVDARQVFEQMPRRNVVSWASMMLGYAQADMAGEVLQLYAQMLQEGVEFNDRTYTIVLKACIAMMEPEQAGALKGKSPAEKCLGTVRGIHTDILQRKLGSNMFLGTMLVDAYAACGSVEDAKQVFEKMSRRDVVSWNTMIVAFVRMGKNEEALHLYSQMQREGVVLNAWTFVAVLKACSNTVEFREPREGDVRFVKDRCLDAARSIHADAVKEKIESDLYVNTMLIDVYAKCGSLEDARRVFGKIVHRDVACWTAMISGHVQMGKGEEALDLYARMRQEGVVPNERTYVSALKACSALVEWKESSDWGATGAKCKCLEAVRSIHRDAAQQGHDSSVFVGTMLVDVYAKCGRLKDARNVFDKMPHHDVVSWTAMILGYAQMDVGDEALQLFTRMQLEGVVPNNRTYIGALNACCGVTGLEKGRQIHAQIAQTSQGAIDAFVMNSLISMYSRCGSMVDAQQVFDAVAKREVVTWNALIAGYAHHGESETVMDLFERMKQEGVQPDEITFLAVLTACSQVGMLDRGHMYFNAMSEDYGIAPTIKHITCMVDLFSRSGQLDRAMDLVKAMPFEPDYALWECVLGACQKWGHVELGQQAFASAVELNKDNPAAYVLMSNIYGSANMWDEAEEVQAMRMRVGAWKLPGQSQLTDMNGTVHIFAAGRSSPPE